MVSKQVAAGKELKIKKFQAVLPNISELLTALPSYQAVELRAPKQ
jgi:hypothetical protein